MSGVRIAKRLSEEEKNAIRAIVREELAAHGIKTTRIESVLYAQPGNAVMAERVERWMSRIDMTHRLIFGDPDVKPNPVYPECPLQPFTITPEQAALTLAKMTLTTDEQLDKNGASQAILDGIDALRLRDAAKAADIHFFESKAGPPRGMDADIVIADEDHDPVKDFFTHPAGE